MKTRFFALIAVLALVFSLTGCGVHITAISLPASLTVNAGETVDAVATFTADKEDVDAARLAEAAGKLELVWTSADEAIARVDASGVVTGVAGGETTVTVATADGAMRACAKVVVKVPLESIDVQESVALVRNGQDTAALRVKLTPEDATDIELAFESSDENVAAVDKNGKVTAVANGECVITVSCGELQGETAVKVDTAPVELKAEDMEITEGKTAQVDVAAEGEDITVGTEYTYTSADEKIATVDEKGTVIAVAAGETEITVTNELGQKTTCTVVVKEAPKQTTTRPAGNTGSNGNAGNGGSTGATAPTQPSGGNGGGSTPAPQPQPQPDPTPAPQPDPTPDVPPSGGAAGGSFDDIIPGGGTEAPPEVIVP